jgi:hypothetical protein
MLNGQNAGVANNEGAFVKENVMPGDYDIQVTLRGHAPFQIRRHLSPSSEQLYANLNITQERLQEMREEQRRAQEKATRAQQLIANAQQQFTLRQYRGALALIDQALQIEPENPNAKQLRNQIVETLKILK